MSAERGPDAGTGAVDEYCRQIERYLTRKNDGHLIRIVGPSFERVRAWAERGVPLKVALAGIDRHFERYYAKGPRRRPVRIDFCEPDVLDIFDEWRRAVGLSVGRRELVDGEPSPRPARDSLARQIERAIVRLTARRAAAQTHAVTIPDGELEAAVGELERLLAAARSARGDRRREILARLSELDGRLLDAARTAAGGEMLAALGQDGERELAPFRDRMPADQWPEARQAALTRLLRERAGLPQLPVE